MAYVVAAFANFSEVRTEWQTKTT